MSPPNSSSIPGESHKYKGAFSLRDEIGTCANIKVKIDVMDKSLFFIRPYHVKEEDKALIDKEIKYLCLLDILKERLQPILLQLC